jgi:PPP family 3-phenylpropionic acid transporter
MNFIIRAYYFLFNVGVGCICGFLPAYLQTKGFSGKEIATITSLGALCGVIGVPLFWGWLADRLQKPTLVLKIIAFGTFAGSAPLLFFNNYWLILGSFIIYAASSIGVMSILDSIASLRAKEKGFDFGKLRLFASAGWLLGSVCLGFFIEYSGRGWDDNSIIYAFVASFALMFLISLGFKTGNAETQERIKLADMTNLFKNRRMILFYLMGMIYLFAITPYLIFYGPLVKSLGFGTSVVGISIGVGTLSEVIFIYFFEKFKKWLGLDLLIIISIVVTIIRWLIIAHTTNAAVLIGIQVLHSEIGLFTMACVSLLTNSVNKRMLTTAQTTFYMVTYGIGQYLGIMVMGYLFDWFEKPSNLFLVAAFINLIPLTLAIINYSIGKKNKSIVIINQEDE